MCLCDATELEDDTDPDLSFHQIEQSPAAVTWVFQSNSGFAGTIGYIDEDNDYHDVVPMIHGDGPELLYEIVCVDEQYVWVLGIGGIYKLEIATIDTPGMTIEQGIGIVAFSLVDDYQFYFEVVHDFDIVDDYVWFIEDRLLKKLHVTDDMGTPTTVADLEPDFGPVGFESHDMLISAASDRLWITKKEANPTVRSYDFTGTEIESVSLAGAVPADMVVERDTDALVMVASGGTDDPDGVRNDTALRVFNGGTTCVVEVPAWTGLDGNPYTDWNGEFVEPFTTRSVGHGSTAGFVVSVRGLQAST